jgi:hypothetical protein
VARWRAAIAPGPPAEVLADHPRAGPLPREKMACLDRGVWLNDEVMNFYISLLLVRSRVVLGGGGWAWRGDLECMPAAYQPAAGSAYHSRVGQHTTLFAPVMPACHACWGGAGRPPAPPPPPRRGAARRWVRKL